MNDHDIHALSGAYAVDALDDVERARFERHLDHCDACRDEVASLQESAAQLGDLDALAPPAALRGRVLEEIKTVRPLPPEVRTAAPRRRTPVWRSALLAACIAGVVGAGAVAVQQVTSDDPVQTVTAADRVLAAGDARTVSAKLPGSASARIVHSAQEGKAVLITSDMPAAPPGKVYELWFQDRAGSMVPAGLMEEGGDQKLLLEGDANAATAVGITIEPAGGSEEPTSAPVALFDFSRAS